MSGDKTPKSIEEELTPVQKKSVNNNVADHLTDGDFSGTRRELEETQKKTLFQKQTYPGNTGTT